MTNKNNNMRKYLLSAICVLTIATVSLSAQKREEIKFIIDGNEVENFDGSQLTGHTVESYNIETVKEGNKLIKKHIILTDKSISVLKVRADTIKVTHHDPVYVINDERVVSKEEFNRLNANDIKFIEVSKKNSETAKKYSAEDGVIMIWLNESKSSTYIPMGEVVKVVSTDPSKNVKVTTKKISD